MKKRKAGRPVSNIPVPKEKLDNWLGLYQVGDFTEISRVKGIGRPTLRNAFRGISALSTIEKIDDFYKKRKADKRLVFEKIKIASL